MSIYKVMLIEVIKRELKKEKKEDNTSETGL